MNQQQDRQIVDPSGKPARQALDTACPKCGAGPDKRVASCGFGTPSTLCSSCGYDFQEVWRGQVER